LVKHDSKTRRRCCRFGFRRNFGLCGGDRGSLLVLLALVIALVKQIIAFIGFLTFAIKAVIVFGFIALILGVAVMIFRGWSKNRREKE
jgi:uncharacterized membrane protein